jgi:impB/mucB/samB family
MLAADFDRDRGKSSAEEPNRHVSVESARQRKIIHIDMDAFYASVEQRDNPDRGRPVAVGGSRERGVVAAASYEAREFGVHSAMPSVTAKRKCPDLIFVKPRFDVYKAVPLQIRAIFAAYTPVVEPLSLDEAYLDVTENLTGISSATQIAEEIRGQIGSGTGLTASAGVSYNKFLAKLASAHHKPDGLGRQSRAKRRHAGRWGVCGSSKNSLCLCAAGHNLHACSRCNSGRKLELLSFEVRGLQWYTLPPRFIARYLFILYADRKLMTTAMIAHIETQFYLRADRTEVQSDWHYQSTETPNALEI